MSYVLLARSVGPTFLWLDNLDSILPSRSNEESEGGGRRGQRTSQKTMDRLLSTLLVEIDGLGNYHKNNNQESGQENVRDVCEFNLTNGVADF